MLHGKKIHNYIPQTNKRKALRKHLTSAEASLWNALKNGQLHGRKFRRQHGIENFIVDFYCASEKLIIEMDGEVHNDPLRSLYDKSRQERLEYLGFKVLRFENKMIFQQTDIVLRTIVAALKQG